MDASKLYKQLDKDFIKKGFSDDWDLSEIKEFVTQEYLNRNMGLVCDNTDKVEKVYTAVFPTKKVIDKIKDKNVLLFVHHPMIWDIRKQNVFTHIDKKSLKKLKDNKISVYNLHVPLDHFGKYSTSVTLARQFDGKRMEAFASYYGSLAGVIGKVNYKTVDELKNAFKKIVGHKVSLYNYGDSTIRNGRVAFVAGGGNDRQILEEVVAKGVNTFVTGITVLNSHSKKAHEFAKENKINILGGTHYSTEKFACIALCDYFRKLGLEAQFINDIPCMDDI